MNWLMHLCGILRARAGEDAGGGAESDGDTGTADQKPVHGTDKGGDTQRPEDRSSRRDLERYLAGDEPTADEATHDDDEANPENPDDKADEGQARGDDDERDGEAADEGEDGDEIAELDDDEEFTPEQKRKITDIVKKRLKKQRTKIEKLQEQADAAEGHKQDADDARAEARRLTAAKTVPSPTRAVPFTAITDEAGLEDAADEFRDARRWLRNHPDGGEYPNGGKPVTLSKEEVADRLDRIEDALETGLPRRRRYLEEERKFHALAQERMPELRNPASALSRAADEVLAAHPALKYSPRYRLLAAQLALGEYASRKLGAKAWSQVDKLQPAGKPSRDGGNPAKKKDDEPPAPTGRSAPPARGKGGDSQEHKARRERLDNGKGTRRDLEESLIEDMGR